MSLCATITWSPTSVRKRAATPAGAEGTPAKRARDAPPPPITPFGGKAASSSGGTPAPTEYQKKINELIAENSKLKDKQKRTVQKRLQYENGDVLHTPVKSVELSSWFTVKLSEMTDITIYVPKTMDVH